MSQVTFYDLGGEDHQIYANLTRTGDVKVVLKNEDDEVIYKEESHIRAWDSIVYLAKQILACDKYIEAQRELRKN